MVIFYSNLEEMAGGAYIFRSCSHYLCKINKCVLQSFWFVSPPSSRPKSSALVTSVSLYRFKHKFAESYV